MTIKDFLEINKNKYSHWLDENWNDVYPPTYIDEIDHFFGDKSQRQAFYDGIQIKILPYLQDIENGFFVECGGATGENTIILENCGWTGMLIEPSETLYNWCLENRPNCINENYALVSSDYDKKTIDGVGKYQGTHIYHRDSKPANISVCERGDTTEIKPQLDYPVISFKELARKYNLKNVDVFFLDVEGYELEVLRGIDFNEVSIKYMIIEVNNMVYSPEELDRIMTDSGFDKIRNLSNFSPITTPFWKGTHQDYLYKNTKL